MCGTCNAAAAAAAATGHNIKQSRAFTRRFHLLNAQRLRLEDDKRKKTRQDDHAFYVIFNQVNTWRKWGREMRRCM